MSNVDVKQMKALYIHVRHVSHLSNSQIEPIEPSVLSEYTFESRVESTDSLINSFCVPTLIHGRIETNI